MDLRWAVRELSEIGDRRIIPDLKKHLADSSMKVRFACVKILSALGEPLRAEWIVPIIRSRQWTECGGFYDPETFVAEHGGANAAGILIECMNMTDPSGGSLWNYRLLNTIKRISPAIPELNCPYNHDEKREGTSQEIRENVQTLNQLKDWLQAHPVDQ